MNAVSFCSMHSSPATLNDQHITLDLLICEILGGKKELKRTKTCLQYILTDTCHNMGIFNWPHLSKN